MLAQANGHGPLRSVMALVRADGSERALSPEPNQNCECTGQPRAGCKKGANDCVPQPIAGKCGQCEGERGDARDYEGPRCSRNRKKRCQVIHRHLYPLTSSATTGILERPLIRAKSIPFSLRGTATRMQENSGNQIALFVLTGKQGLL
jgi:hypothetical protein